MELDLAIILAYAACLVGIGFYGMRRARTREDFLVAGRRLGPVMYAATMSTVVLGGASTVGTVKLGYEYGISGLWFCAMLGLGVFVTSIFLSRHLLRLNLYTVTEVFERRYNVATRVGSGLIMCAYALMVAVASMVACGTILQGLFGLPFAQGVLLAGGIVVLYSVVGGMWSITLTDLIQFVVMTVGILFLLAPLAIHGAGGWQALHQVLPAGHFSLSNLGAPMLLGFALNYFLGIMIGQDIWQRVFTARSVGVARTAGAVAAGYCVLYGIAGALVGMAARAALPALPDTNLAFAAIAREALPEGLRGLVVAAALAAMMSTSSATLMASATTLAEDLLPRLRPTWRGSLAVDRVSMVATGVVALAFSLFLSDVFAPLTIAYDLLVGSMLVPLIGAIYWKRAHATAATASMAVSALVTVIFLVRDGTDANSAIFFGLGSSIAVYGTLCLLRRGEVPAAS